MKSRYIGLEEVEKIKKEAGEDVFLPFWISLETGMRVGDVVKLKYADIKPDGIHFVAEKTKKRGISQISCNLRTELEYRGKGKPKRSYVFPSPKKSGEHLTRQAVWQRIKKAGKAAGVDLEGLSPHTFRKIYAVELYREKGFNAVKQALQHNHNATTELYAFADWGTGKNAEEPLRRRDLQLIIKMVLEALDHKKT